MSAVNQFALRVQKALKKVQKLYPSESIYFAHPYSSYERGTNENQKWAYKAVLSKRDRPKANEERKCSIRRGFT